MWLDTDGTEMADEDWNSGYVRCLAMMLSGDTMDVRDRQGEPMRDDTFLVLFNAHHEPVTFTLPGKKDVSWEACIDTRHEAGAPGSAGLCSPRAMNWSASSARCACCGS